MPVVPTITKAAAEMSLCITLPSQIPVIKPLSGQTLVIGRAVDADIRIESDTVSRRHAELVKDPFGRWWIQDLASRNGTCVNGVQVDRSLVEPGDNIRLGESTLALVPIGSALAPAATPPSERSAEASRTIVDAVDRPIRRLRELAPPRIDHSHLTSILDFGHAAGMIQDEAQRLGLLADLMLGPALRARGVAVLRILRDKPTDAQVIRGPHVVPNAGLESMPFSASVLRAIAQTPEPVLVTNMTGGSSRIMLTMPAEVMELAVIAAPLHADAQSVDLLYVILPPECGNSDWLALVSLAARQYQQAHSLWQSMGKIKEYAAIRRELQRAQEIQQRLVPRRLDIPGLELAVGFRPCQWVGGDCVAIVPMEGNRALLAVADVCGKGLPAALVASCVHTMLHSAARTHQRLSDIVIALNDYLCQFLGFERFATVLCIAIDPATGRCESISAGHPQALIVGRDGRLRALASELCQPLGIAEISVSSTHDQLEPGEMLMMFSDGITEMLDDSQRMLGTEGLGEGLQILYPPAADEPLDALVTRLDECLKAFLGRELAQDDQTFLLVRRKSSAGEERSP